ncbi:cytochrome P450 family protein [Rhizoctonia solani AG-3 Rhs1AP]|uniref:Cytochrome P450 family protein n=1 Tax=Rhizoctonia solani AG-3 Rhs1AP TaxID=1086054 RepID=X8JAX5_9AGAM|nr:cytochrome P450 family protein [Rhizoctonia solani AG-3 Rhs1AP]
MNSIVRSHFLPYSPRFSSFSHPGSIISLQVLGQVIIVLNSIDDVQELLVKRSLTYSDRPQLEILSNPALVGWGNGSAVLNYGDRWRGQRKFKHEVLHKEATELLWPVMTKQARLAMQRILETPQNFADEISRMTGATILSSTYGYDVSTVDDQMMKILKVGMKGFCDAAIPGSFLVNSLSWLQYVPSWFPGTGWKRRVATWRKEREAMMNTSFNWTKKQMVAGTAQPSIVNSLLTKLAAHPPSTHSVEEEEDRIKWATGSLYGAMLRYPDVQARAQREIDTAVGDQRLPRMEDYDQLPYVARIIKEVLRWRPVAPLGVAHANSQDDIYRGYRVPKRAIVVMCNDPDVYIDPEKFDLDRFLDPVVPEAPVFGFGRRSCPCIHFAQASLFITISTMLAVFNIAPTRDKQGNDVIPDAKMSPDSFVRFPLGYECTIEPRSESRAKLLLEY